MEGIFDYFAFYRLLQDEGKPMAVSTLGTNLDDQAEAILRSLGVENVIAAFDWDHAGRVGIVRVAEKLQTQAFYLGGMKEGHAYADL